MEKDNENTLQKIRSSRACIRDGYQWYTAHFRRIFRSTWLTALVFAAITATASAMPVLISPTLVIPAICLEALAVVLLLLFTGKQLRRKQLLEPVAHNSFGAWMRNLGLVIIVSIICLLVVAILTLLTSLPTIIMMAANWESQMGVINGDPVGMPDYVMWLSIGAFLIAGFLRAYVWLTILCPLYLTKASIAMQEKEREEFNQKTNTKNNEEKAIVYRP